ncbi:AMP-binding protein, partial [Nocardia cyriacigeorgica]|uniref:AMP-binding protein n=1 Tax=Nocardia cyriacigeorgica TaxID=135487 RepID=UPI003CC7F6C2
MPGGGRSGCASRAGARPCPETIVGLGALRSIDMLVAMYAIVRSGAAYVPIDPEHPAERIAHVIAAAA